MLFYLLQPVCIDTRFPKIYIHSMFYYRTFTVSRLSLGLYFILCWFCVSCIVRVLFQCFSCGYSVFSKSIIEPDSHFPIVSFWGFENCVPYISCWVEYLAASFCHLGPRSVFVRVMDYLDIYRLFFHLLFSLVLTLGFSFSAFYSYYYSLKGTYTS